MSESKSLKVTLFLKFLTSHVPLFFFVVVSEIEALVRFLQKNDDIYSSDTLKIKIYFISRCYVKNVMANRFSIFTLNVFQFPSQKKII